MRWGRGIWSLGRLSEGWKFMVRGVVEEDDVGMGFGEGERELGLEMSTDWRVKQHELNCDVNIVSRHAHERLVFVILMVYADLGCLLVWSCCHTSIYVGSFHHQGRTQTQCFVSYDVVSTQNRTKLEQIATYVLLSRAVSFPVHDP